MKSKKLSDFYSSEFILSHSNIDEPIFGASADEVDELQVTKEEYPYVLAYGISNGVYHYVIQDGAKPYHSVLGMRIKII